MLLTLVRAGLKRVEGRCMGKLTATEVRAALKQAGTYQDGEGLFLKTSGNGSGSWLLRVQHEGKRRDIGIGSAKVLSLAEARSKAGDLRKTIRGEGRDILAERREAKAAAVTFKAAAKQYHEENEGGWKSEAYGQQWLASLERHVFPKFGDRPANDIEAADIVEVLLPIWQDIPETARRVRHRVCQVLDFAHARGWRRLEAPSSSGSLKAGRGLPKQVKEKANRKAMPYTAVPAFVASLRTRPSFGRLALELTILTAVRSQEARLAEWDEFDLKANLWTIPADRMKRGKAHVVPLSAAAQNLVERAAAFRMADQPLLFPGANGGPMSDMTLLKVLRDAGQDFHVHGFRSGFTDWAAEHGFADAIVEAALAHKTPDATQAAYRRTTYLGTQDQPGARVKLMDQWGAFVASGGGKVVPFRAARK